MQLRRAIASVTLAAVLLGGGGACAREPVDWDEATERAAPPPADAYLALDGAGRAHFLRPLTPLTLPPPQIAPGECRTSVRVAAATALDMYSTWWSVRPSGAAAPKVARTDDGGRTWRVPVVVDSTDRGVRGCDRPPLGVAADSTARAVYVVYFVQASEGPGVFFSHSMDRGALFHAPVPVVYGERPVAAAVAASGDRVAVAYENPNSATPQISLALSRTSGHIFEERIDVTSGTIPSVAPRVALRGTRIAVSWLEPPAVAGRDTVAVVRYGTMR